MVFQKLMSRLHESLVATNHGQPHHHKSKHSIGQLQYIKVTLLEFGLLCIAGDIGR